MKKISLILILCFVSIISTAQQEISTAYATAATNMFAPLDKNRIPHKVLLDYGFEYTNLKAFNGVLADSTTVDAPTLKHIYNTIFSSRVTSTTTGFINPNNFDSNWKTNRVAGTITLSGLYYKYNAFINDAINLGKVNFVNNQFQDKFVSGVWQNPYHEFQAFAMAPAITKYEGLSFNTRIPSTIFYSNYQSLVQSIQVDFGNGAGYITVPFNQNVTVNYPTEGVKIWKYKLNLTNGTSLLSQSRIEVTQGITTIPWGTTTSALAAASVVASSTIYSQSITASKNYNGALGRVKLTIDDINSDGIRKPLIVAEGFDAGIILAPELPRGMNTYFQFKSSIDNSNSSDLRNLLSNSNRQYDIIYVDWDNGVDFLQNNAFALEAVIAWVNSVKIGTEKNVVLGQSMGGVVARYALADMEQSSIDHKTRLFVSHDAPQQGANIPVSVQYMFRHVTNLYNRYASPYGTQVINVPFLENSILDQPATKQMLMNWSNSSYTIINTISSSFYTELKGKGINPTVNGGYPINCRNIAISNGAECGITQGFNAGDDLLSYNLSTRLPFFQNLLVPLAGYVGFTAYLDPNLLAIGFVGLLPGSSKYGVEFNAKSIPYGTNNQIYKGRISYTKKLFSIFGWAPTITINITNVQKNQPTGVLPLDHYAGGRYETSLLTSNIAVPAGMYIRDRFNFIPTPSALDIGKGNITLTDSDYKMAYVGATPPVAPKNSPFANFSTDFERTNPNSSNNRHISFNSRNGNWFAKELNLVPETTNCAYMCSNVQISGPETICTTANFAVTSGVPIYNWSITEGASLVSITGSNTSICTLTSTNTGSGFVTIRVVYGDNNIRCGTRTQTKRVWLGLPQLINYTFETNNGAVCITDGSNTYSSPQINLNDRIRVNVTGLSSAEALVNSNWEWQTLNNVVMINGTRNTRQICPMAGGQTSISFRFRNACGWSDWTEIPFQVIQTPAPMSMSMMSQTETIFKIYPNPTNNIVNVDLRDQNQSPNPNATIIAELYNMMGEIKSTIEITNNLATINATGLPRGIYLLKINIDGVVETHQVGVE